MTNDAVIALGMLLLFAVPIAVLLRRANELFVVRVVAGRSVHARGRVPRKLLAEISDILQRARLTSLELRVVSEDGRAALKWRGVLGEAEQQQLRNVMAQYSVAQIRRGAPKRARERAE